MTHVGYYTAVFKFDFYIHFSFRFVDNRCKRDTRKAYFLQPLSHSKQDFVAKYLYLNNKSYNLLFIYRF